jgi:hypothetical protein
MPIAFANKLRNALRWSIARAAITPRSSATACKRFRFPGEIFTNCSK